MLMNYIMGALFAYTVFSAESLKLFRAVVFLLKNKVHINHMTSLLKGLSKSDLLVLVSFYGIYIIAAVVVFALVSKELSNKLENTLIILGLNSYLIINSLYFLKHKFKKMFFLSILMVLYINFIFLLEI